MTTQTTPSKNVCHERHLNRHAVVEWLTDSPHLQAASGLEKLKMGDSPAKKLNFDPVDKENNLQNTMPVVSDADLKKAHVEVIEKGQKPVVAPTIKDHEADEPLLQENPHRFVLFPIKYHEVRVHNASTRKVFSQHALTNSTDMANVQESRSIILDR